MFNSIVLLLFLSLLQFCSSNNIENIIAKIGSIPLLIHCIDNLIDAEENNRGGDPSALMRAAVCFHIERDEPRALYLYGRVRDHNPDFAYVLVNIGIIALKGGDADTAIVLFEQYLNEVGSMYGDKTPSDAISLRDGTPCRYDALNKQDCVNALNNLASAHISKRNPNIGLPYLRRAIQIGDKDMLLNVYSNLGGYYSNIGDTEGAADAFLQAFWISYKNGNMDPSNLVRRAILVPPVSGSASQVLQMEKLFLARIKDMINLAQYGGYSLSKDIHDLFRTSVGISNPDDIRNLPPLQNTLNDWTSGIQSPHFYLHYYGFHDKPIQQLVAKMYSILCPSSLYEVSQHLQNYSYSTLSGSVDNGAPMIPKISDVGKIQFNQGRQQARKLRIGFVSSHFGGDEPHGLLLIDVIRRLPKKAFVIMAVGIGAKKPSDDFVDALSGNYHSVGYNDVLARRLLMNEELDCLIFAEMQNEAVVHFLGYQRFAPIQILVMGSPVTSGNPSIDYFISGDRLEHPFRTHMSGSKISEEHYSEQVVLLDGQAISFPKLYSFPLQDAKLAAGDAKIAQQSISGGIDKFGIPNYLKNGSFTLYMCFQSLHKLQPSFDNVLAQILHADQKAHIIMQAGRKAQITDIITTRIMSLLIEKFSIQSAKETFSRIIFIPRVTSNEIMNLLKIGTVVLHPWPFGGSKTAADAIGAGVPLVTYPQPYLRGRMAASFYITMELHTIDPDISAYSCCVASSASDYISKALRLANDREYRRKVSIAITQRSHRIWDDKQTSFEWARFLTRALGVVIHYDELALELDYHPETWQSDDALRKGIVKAQQQWKFVDII